MTVATYRGYKIYANPNNIDARCDWLFEHEDYDGADDAFDHRHGFGKTIQECKDEIDNQIEEANE